MSISGMIRRKMNEMKANQAAKRITAEKVAAERRRSYERQELEKVRLAEKANLKQYEAQRYQKQAPKAGISAAIARFGGDSSSPFAPMNAAPSGSDNVRSVFGMNPEPRLSMKKARLKKNEGGNRRNVFYD